MNQPQGLFHNFEIFIHPGSFSFGRLVDFVAVFEEIELTHLITLKESFGFLRVNPLLIH